MVALLLLSAVTIPTEPTLGLSQQPLSLQASFRQHMQSKRAKGGALLIVSGSDRISATYGVRDSKGAPYLTTTPNRIASVSKPITAVAILTLVQSGKLRLDDSALEILNKERERPIVPKQPVMQNISIRQLLNHTSGFGNDKFLYNHLDLAKTHKFKLPVRPDNLVDLAFTTQNLTTNPGASFQYSNAGYLILGRVIEKVSGKSYEDYVHASVLAPAGIGKSEAFIASTVKLAENETEYWDLMNRTGFSVYTGKVDSRVPMQYGMYSTEAMDAHGGWAMSVEALVKFQQALPRLVSTELQQQVTAMPRTAVNPSSYMGLGFTVIPESEGGFTIMHGGSLEGCNAGIMYRANGQIIAVTCNTGGAPDDNSWSFNYINSTLCPLLNQVARP